MKIFKGLMLIIAMSLLTIACGSSSGGGGGGDDGTPSQTGATLTAQNAKLAASGVGQAIDLIELGDLLEGISIIGISNSSNQILSDSQIGALGSLPATTQSCAAGTMTVSATWEGPNNPTSASQIIDMNANATFNSCKLGTMTFNGAAIIQLSGPANNPASVNFSSSNLNASDSATGDNITMTNISFLITNTSLTISGAISGTADGQSINEEYDNFTISESSTSGGTLMTLSGKMKSSCLGGWVTIDTTTAIFVPTNASCPTDGEVVITSNGDTVTLVIQSDASMDVYFNDVIEESYNSCSELDDVCSS